MLKALYARARKAVIGMVTAVALFFGGCSAVSQDLAQGSAALNAACADVAAAEKLINSTPAGALPQAQVIEGYAAGACIAGIATTALLDKLATNPQVIAWTEGLATDLKGLVPKGS